jgi:Sigma-70 factor, region 1.1
MPAEEVTSEQIEDILATLNEMGINVTETAEAEADEQEARETVIKWRCPLYPQKRTFAHAIRTSALGPIADSCTAAINAGLRRGIA